MSDTVKDFDLQIDPDALTIGDLEDFEEGVGKPLHEALKPTPVLDEDGNKVFDAKGRPELQVNLSAKALRYLVWIVKRQTDPSFTPDDARKVRVGQLELAAPEPTSESGNESALPA